MKVLDLFSGIGGFSLGLERAGMQTVAFCEIEEYPRLVLRKHWPDVPIHEDIRELKADAIGPVDLVCGGYPCQPFSLAGKRAGEDDDRHLWPEMLRLVEACRPRWVIAENVAGHISMGLDQVLSDLESAGYTAWTFVVPAVAVDAPHRRDRLWIVANASSRRCSREGTREVQRSRRAEVISASETLADSACKLSHGCGERPAQDWRAEFTDCGEALADSDSERLEVRQGEDSGRTRQDSRSQLGRSQRWPTEPAVGRVANGIPRRVERLRALGNAVVPQIPELIGRAILAVEAA